MQPGYPPPARCWREALLNEYRFKWIAFPAIKGYLRMYPGDFRKIFPRGRWIIKTARHVSAVIDGTIHDTFRFFVLESLFQEHPQDAVPYGIHSA
jgi:hypothetical protein